MPGGTARPALASGKEKGAAVAKPSKFSHVVYRTRRYEEMLRWYQQVFEAEIQHQSRGLAFLTYDDEHHRFAFANLDVMAGPGDPNERSGAVGVDHVAYTYDSAGALLDTYERLRDNGIKPHWCVHHGITLSMYYRDPDGNRMEFQVDCFEKRSQAGDYMKGEAFARNPIGNEYDPEALLARHRGGASESELLAPPAA